MPRFSYPVARLLPPSLDARVSGARAAVGRDLELARDIASALVAGYQPLLTEIALRARNRERPFVLGVSGGQGSGKTTFARFASALLNELHGLRACAVSIDDFYLERAERRELGNRVHALLATRGVPGTHDVELALRTFDALAGAGEGERVPLPTFDKALDDRALPDRWSHALGPIDVIVFEGWCVGAGPQADTELVSPVNALEAAEDSQLVWRRFVNQRLATTYADWFARIDALVFFEVPGFREVRRWRGLQERKLARRSPSGPGVMDAETLDRFLMHYERTTLHALATLPATADFVYTLDSAQRLLRLTTSMPLRLH